jgi:cation transport ATPase
LAIVKAETAKARALFVRDVINDAPALVAATVGVAFGSQNDITMEASHAVVLETALEKIHDLMDIARRMRRKRVAKSAGRDGCQHSRRIAAALGCSPPLGGAIDHDLILFAVLNASRFPPKIFRTSNRSVGTAF